MINKEIITTKVWSDLFSVVKVEVSLTSGRESPSGDLSVIINTKAPETLDGETLIKEVQQLVNTRVIKAWP